MLSLERRLIGLAQGGRDLSRGVAFRIDDGYADRATVAAPIFAQFDCPVTTFVTTGFLDRDVWFWWDKIEYVCHKTSRSDLALFLAGERIDYRWTGEGGRRRAQEDLTERCKRIPDVDKKRAMPVSRVRRGWSYLGRRRMDTSRSLGNSFDIVKPAG